VAETLELMALADRRTAGCGRLSGGQRRRLDVALSLIGDPELVYVPGIIAFGLIAAAFSNGAVTVVRTREAGIYKRRRVTSFRQRPHRRACPGRRAHRQDRCPGLRAVERRHQPGWGLARGDAKVVASLAASAVLLAAFAVVEIRSKNPPPVHLLAGPLPDPRGSGHAVRRLCSLRHVLPDRVHAVRLGCQPRQLPRRVTVPK
jgi:hypothetical protein